MKSVSYSDLKQGKIYISYQQMSNKKVVFIFQILDSKPVNDSFTIIDVKTAICRDEYFNLVQRENFATSLFPCENIFIFNKDDIENHILIPQL